MSDVFYWVLNLSILGSFIGLLVLLLRRVRAIPRFAVYLLWLLPLLRLWLPASLSSRYSLFNLLSGVATKTVTVWEASPALPPLTSANYIKAADSYFPIVYKTDLLKNIFTVCGFIWAVVAAAAVLCSVMLYIFTKSALRKSEHVRDNIFRSDKIAAPAVYGIFRPKIILPASLAEEDLDYILKHERVHIRRRDNLWRVVAVATACLHWFNPLAWVFLKCFFADAELACDAGVLKKLDKDGRKAYASALLSCSAGKTYYASAFGGARTRLRIENILSYKKLTLASGLCLAALLIAAAVTLLTNGVGG